jgi:hypothetical protein
MHRSPIDPAGHTENKALELTPAIKGSYEHTANPVHDPEHGGRHEFAEASSPGGMLELDALI